MAERAGAGAEGVGREGALEQGEAVGDDGTAGGIAAREKTDEGLEAFGDDVGVGKLVFVGQRFPRGEKPRGRRVGSEPGGEVGLEAFLRFEAVGDDDENAVGEESAKECGDEGMGAG